jgi:hypothetical protein
MAQVLIRDDGEARPLERLCARANEIIDAISRSGIGEGDVRQQLAAELHEVDAAIVRMLGSVPKAFAATGSPGGGRR